MATLEELRAQIDTLDHQILEHLGQRARIVQQVGELKRTQDEVYAPDRQEQVIASRRAWALQHNLDPDFVETLYRTLLDYFIEQQRQQIAQRNQE